MFWTITVPSLSSWARKIQFMLSYSFFRIHFKIILSSGSSKVSFFQVAPPKPCTQFSLLYHTPCPFPPWFDHLYIWWAVKIIKLLIMQFSPVFYCPLSIPHCEHTKPMFFPFCERPSFSLTQAKLQFCIF